IDDEDKDISKSRSENTSRAERNASQSAGSGSDSDSDSDSDADSKPQTPSKPSKRLYARNEPAPATDANSLRATMRSAFSDFLHSGLKAIKGRGQTPSPNASKRVATSVASKRKDSIGDDDALNLLKNAIGYPDFPVFPRLYSGVKRLEGGDLALVRAGVYKKFQLRDRLGETFFISQARAFAYDGSDDDATLVRHYFLSSSYLVSLDGPRVPAAGDADKAGKPKTSSSATPTSSAPSTAETTAVESAEES
ncbi:hypothetical protein GGI02_006130, partial [Coemansia sp. RSA 2322]